MVLNSVVLFGMKPRAFCKIPFFILHVLGNFTNFVDHFFKFLWGCWNFLQLTMIFAFEFYSFLFLFPLEFSFIAYFVLHAFYHTSLLSLSAHQTLFLFCIFALAID